MKKSIALILALVLVLALAACGGGSGDGDKTGTVTYTEEELVDRLASIVEGKTGEMMVENIGLSTLAENAGGQPSDFFGTWFNGMALPEGTKVAVSQAMMMGQPHVVFLIQPASGTKAEDFAKELETNANPNWNICTTADYVKSVVKDGVILFIMTKPVDDFGVQVIDADGIVTAFNG